MAGPVVHLLPQGLALQRAARRVPVVLVVARPLAFLEQPVLFFLAQAVAQGPARRDPQGARPVRLSIRLAWQAAAVLAAAAAAAPRLVTVAWAAQPRWPGRLLRRPHTVAAAAAVVRTLRVALVERGASLLSGWLNAEGDLSGLSVMRRDARSLRMASHLP